MGKIKELLQEEAELDFIIASHLKERTLPFCGPETLDKILGELCIRDIPHSYTRKKLVANMSYINVEWWSRKTETCESQSWIEVGDCIDGNEM